MIPRVEDSAGVRNASFISLDGLRALFYLVTPSESSFEKVEEVPDYVGAVSKPNTDKIG